MVAPSYRAKGSGRAWRQRGEKHWVSRNGRRQGRGLVLESARRGQRQGIFAGDRGFGGPLKTGPRLQKLHQLYFSVSTAQKFEIPKPILFSYRDHSQCSRITFQACLRYSFGVFHHIWPLGAGVLYGQGLLEVGRPPGLAWGNQRSHTTWCAGRVPSPGGRAQETCPGPSWPWTLRTGGWRSPVTPAGRDKGCAGR